MEIEIGKTVPLKSHWINERFREWYHENVDISWSDKRKAKRKWNQLNTEYKRLVK